MPQPLPRSEGQLAASSQAGNRTVRLRFAEVDHQFFFNFGVDKCSLNVSGIGDVLVNGTFESNGGAGTNSFTGWTVYNASLGSNGDFLVQTGATSPLVINAFPVPVPTDGAFAAMTDQEGPGLHILYQDVFIPAAGAQLTCDLFVGSQAPFAIAAAPGPAQAPALTPIGLVVLTAILLWLSRRSMRASALR